MKFLHAQAAAAIAMLGLAPVSADAQPRSASRSAGEVRQVVVFGRDACPRSSGDDIIICARRPESERYRVPRAVRERTRERDGNNWAARARALEYVGRTGIQSCSTVGPGGHTGCWEEMMRAAREEREAAEQDE